MLKPKAIAQVLQQANTRGVHSTLLLGLDGSLIAFSTIEQSGSVDRNTRVRSALAADLHQAYEKVSPGGDAEAPEAILVSCDDGKALIRRFGNLLLCLIAQGHEMHFGGLKLKADALVEHLSEPLKSVSIA